MPTVVPQGAQPPAAPGAAPLGIAPPEVVKVHERRVACDGVGGALGHPRVWLEMGDKPFVECGYCDRRFVLAAGDPGEDERLDPAAYDPQDTPEA